MARATAKQLNLAKQRIDEALRQLGPGGAVEDRQRIRRAVMVLRRNIRTRRRQHEREIQKLDRLYAKLQVPWRAAGPSALHAVLSLLDLTNGRVWALRLQATATKMFGMDRGPLWTALRMLEAQGIVRVHMRTTHKGCYGVPGKRVPIATPTWIEVLAITGGDGVAPPPDTHLKAWDHTMPPPKVQAQLEAARSGRTAA